jgi:hypothetical protein
MLRPRDVVYLKGILEASEGLAQLFAEEGGAVTIATTTSQAGALDALLDEVFAEVGAVVVDPKLVPVEPEQAGAMEKT